MLNRCCLLVLFLGLTCSASEERNERPNFILFFPDTLRAESFNAYGNGVKGVSPRLDAFSSQGTLFEQAHVMHTQCSPSRATMLTGRYMHVQGHRTQIHLIRAFEENYLRVLKNAGYHVRWYGKNDALSAASFNYSVSYWENEIGYDSGKNRYAFNESGYWSMLYSGGSKMSNDTSNGDTAAVLKAVEWLTDTPPEPFVLFLPTRGAHPPYGAPADFQNTITLKEVKAAVTLRPANLPGKPTYHGYKKGIPHYRNLTFLPSDTFYEIQRSYLEMISYTDHLFGMLLDGLDRSPVVNRTAVFFSSDHGDYAGDYGLIEKWPGGADDVLTRVPLVARMPNYRQGGGGHVVKSPVQSMDIMETMIDFAGIETDWVRFGKSFREQMEHGTEGDLSRDVYSEGGFSYHSELFPGGSDHVADDPTGMYWPRAQEEMSGNGTGSPRWVMIRNLTAKLVYRPNGVSELYDLSSDSRELRNIFHDSDSATLRNEMMSKLSAWLVTTGDVPPLRNDPRGPPTYPSVIDAETCRDVMEPDPSDEREHAEPSSLDYMRLNGVPNARS